MKWGCLRRSYHIHIRFFDNKKIDLSDVLIWLLVSKYKRVNLMPLKQWLEVIVGCGNVKPHKGACLSDLRLRFIKNKNSNLDR